MGLQLAKLLVGEGLVSVDQVREAVEVQRNSGRGLGDSLVTLGHITETDFLGFLGKYYGMPVMDLGSRSIEPDVLKLIPQGTAVEECLIPVSLVGADLIVAVSDPSNILLIDDLGFITGKHIVPVIASERAISAKITEYYGESPGISGRESDSAGRLPRAGKLLSIEEILRGLEEYTNDNREFTSAVSAEESLSETDLSEGDETLPRRAEVVDEESSAVIDNAVFDLTGSESGDDAASGSRNIEIGFTEMEFSGGDSVPGFAAEIGQGGKPEIESRTEEGDQLEGQDEGFNLEIAEAGMNGGGETVASEISLPWNGRSVAASADENKSGGAGDSVTSPTEHTAIGEQEGPLDESGLYPFPDTKEDALPGSQGEAEELADRNVSSGVEKVKNGAGVKLPKSSILIVDHSPTIR